MCLEATHDIQILLAYLQHDTFLGCRLDFKYLTLKPCLYRVAKGSCCAFRLVAGVTADSNKCIKKVVFQREDYISSIPDVKPGTTTASCEILGLPPSSD